MKRKAQYTVWVGGAEVNDHLLTLTQAEKLETYWLGLGYDVVIEMVEHGAKSAKKGGEVK